jgi:hypothetical protein
MLLAGALFALFMTGFWLYCLTDAIVTPGPECRGLRKPAWIVVIAATFIGGAVAWLIVGSPVRSSFRPLARPARWGPDDDYSRWEQGDDYVRAGRMTDADDALALRAGRARMAGAAWPKGPDDNAEFLRTLDRLIGGNSQAGEEV